MPRYLPRASGEGVLLLERPTCSGAVKAGLAVPGRAHSWDSFCPSLGSTGEGLSAAVSAHSTLGAIVPGAAYARGVRQPRRRHRRPRLIPRQTRSRLHQPRLPRPPPECGQVRRISSRRGGRRRTSGFARQPAGLRSPATCIFAGQQAVERACTPKMPGEPMRVQPSRAKRSTSEDA